MKSEISRMFVIVPGLQILYRNLFKLTTLFLCKAKIKSCLPSSLLEHEVHSVITPKRFGEKSQEKSGFAWGTHFLRCLVSHTGYRPAPGVWGEIGLGRNKKFTEGREFYTVTSGSFGRGAWCNSISQMPG